MRRDGSELPGWPVRSDPLPLHTGGRGVHSGAVDATPRAARSSPRSRSRDLDRDGSLEVIGADMKGKLYVWNADGLAALQARGERRLLGQAADAARERAQRPPLPDAARVHRFAGGGRPGRQRRRLEIVAAAMDRHVYAWDSDGDAVPGFPVLVVDRSKISSIDPQTHAPTFSAAAGAELDQGAIIDTPAVGDLDGDGEPEIVVGTNEEYDGRGTTAASTPETSTPPRSRVLAQTGQLDLGNSRAVRDQAGRASRAARRRRPVRTCPAGR